MARHNTQYPVTYRCQAKLRSRSASEALEVIVTDVPDPELNHGLVIHLDQRVSRTCHSLGLLPLRREDAAGWGRRSGAHLLGRRARPQLPGPALQPHRPHLVPPGQLQAQEGEKNGTGGTPSGPRG